MVCEMGVKWQLLFCEVLLPGFVRRRYTGSLCSFYQAFSPIVSLKTVWYSHTIIRTWLQFEKYFYNVFL